MKKSRLFAGIVLMMALLLTAVPAFAADPNPGSGNTDVVVVNTNQDTNASAASVNALYYDVDGNVDYNRPQTINPRGSQSLLAADTPLGDGWQGSMILQSDYELAAVAEITWSDGSAAPDGITGGAYTGYAFGSTTMYLPFAVYSVDAQFTRFTVQNTEDAAATIQLEFIDRGGVLEPGFTITNNLSGLGSKTYDLHDSSTGVPNLASSQFWQDRCNEGHCFWSGAVKITSLNNKEIAAVATNHWRNWAVAYNGTSTGATRAYIPSVERRCTDCNWNGGTWQGYSVITVQCVETATSCNVTMDFVNEGGTNSLTLPTLTVNPGAAVAASTRAGNDWDANLFHQSLGGGQTQAFWAGSVIARTTNSTNIAVISYSIRPGKNTAGASSGANVADAGRETFLPAIYQSGESCNPPGFDWTKFSIIRVQNPTGTNATDVDIYYYNQDGSTAHSVLNQSIQAGKSLSQHTRVDCATLPLGNNWQGSMYITSDQPLVAVAETNYWNVGERANAYNGYSVTR